MKKYEAILKLHLILSVLEIPHELEKRFDGAAIMYPNGEERVADVVEFTGSYGAGLDLLEIAGLLTPEEAEFDDVAGYLSVQDAAKRIADHYEARKEG